MIAPILAAVIPVLAVTGIGYFWVRSGQTFENSTLTPLVVHIATPCLILATFMKTVVSPASFAVVALASVTAICCFGLLGAAVLAASGLRVRTFLPALTFPNNGNLGLPVALYAFGQEGLGYAIVFYAICMIGQFTIGQAIAAGSTNWRGIVRMPLLYSVALGVAVSIGRFQLPGWLSQTISLIGGMTIPLMLLMLGASLARLPVEAVGRAGVLAVFRIGLGIAVGVAIAFLFGLSETARAVLILQCAMPPAVYNYLFAQRWNNQPEEVASVVVVSTVVSTISVPMLLHFLM